MKQKSADNTDVVSCKHSFVELLVNDMALITFDTKSLGFGVPII